MGGATREPEQAQFLGWLREQLQQTRAEVLVVAGDIFHHVQPSAEAQQLYFDFLASLKQCPDLRKTVVVAGNHDSATRIDAPRELLRAISVVAVGDPSVADPRSLLVPIAGASDAIVVAAAPYIHPWRLGLRGAEKSAEAALQELHAGFAAFYTRLADAAEEYSDHAPICTGHLTCVGAQEGDYQTQIHWMGASGAFPATTFDARFQYVALGHIHRSFAVDGGRVWYSGSPVALNITELSPRSVNLVEVGSASAEVTQLRVPDFRRVYCLIGDVEEVRAAIKQMEPSERLAPYVHVRLTTDEHKGVASGMLADFAAKIFPEHTPRIVSVEAAKKPQKSAISGAVPRSLASTSPEDLFVLLCEKRLGAAPDPLLLQAFREALLQTPEESGGAA